MDETSKHTYMVSERESQDGQSGKSPVAGEVTELALGKSSSTNRATVVAVALGLVSMLMWLIIFISSFPYGLVAGIVLGLVGVAFGIAGIVHVRWDGRGDMVTAVLGLACPLAGLATSVIITFALLSLAQALSELNTVLDQAVTELSVASDALQSGEATPAGEDA